MRVPAGTLKMLDPAEDCYDLSPPQVSGTPERSESHPEPDFQGPGDRKCPQTDQKNEKPIKNREKQSREHQKKPKTTITTKTRLAIVLWAIK